jgi:hypothetical protein
MKLYRLLEVNLNLSLSNIKIKRTKVEFFAISTVRVKVIFKIIPKFDCAYLYTQKKLDNFKKNIH